MSLELFKGLLTNSAARHLPAFNAEACRVLEPDREIDLLGLGVLPFSVPHDAREPVQYPSR